MSHSWKGRERKLFYSLTKGRITWIEFLRFALAIPQYLCCLTPLSTPTNFYLINGLGRCSTSLRITTLLCFFFRGLAQIFAYYAFAVRSHMVRHHVVIFKQCNLIPSQYLPINRAYIQTKDVFRGCSINGAELSQER